MLAELRGKRGRLNPGEQTEQPAPGPRLLLGALGEAGEQGPQALKAGAKACRVFIYCEP